MLNESLAPAALPEGLRVYAVGDVHGCDDRLAALHALIARDATARPAAHIVLLHIGDYVDRGPDSAGVIRRVMGAPPVPGAEVVNLRGNHEALLLAGHGPRAAADDAWLWLRNGGRQTLRSYGAAEERGVIPAAHLDFLRGLPSSWRAGGYFFAHAGVRPGVTLDAQADDDLLWIREPFLSSQADHGAVVVHGHTPRDTVEVRRNRIGLDTAAVFGGVLTCLVLEADRMGFLSA